MIIGIDPGGTGCIAVLDDAGNYLDHLHMPLMKLGKANRVNSAAAIRFLREYDEARHCYLEQVAAMPGNGGSSMFSFGHAAGIIEGVVVALGIPITLVPPAAWKKALRLTGKDKDAARARAIQLYPGIPDLDLKGKGQALADAILIGRHGAGI
jgi:crossover junction endodeoxyribonuclease RuvC